MIDYLFQRREAAIVHVGRGYGDIPQGRRLELADVLRLAGLFEYAPVRSRVVGHACIEEAAAGLTLARRCIFSIEANAAAEVPSTVALEAAPAFAGKEHAFS